MRRQGRTKPPLPLLHSYAVRQGLAGSARRQDRRTRRLELAPRVGGTINRYTAYGGAGGGGGGSLMTGCCDIEQTLIVGDDANGQDLRNLGRLSLQDGGLLTIDGADSVTVTETYHEVQGAGGGVDDLDTINGAIGRQMTVLKRANGAGAVTVKHAVGNIRCVGNADFDLDDDHDWAWFFREDTLATGTVLAMPGFGAGGGGGVNVQEDTVPLGVATTMDFTEPDAALIAFGAGTATFNMALYAMLTGRAGGQTLYGGYNAGDDLILESTSHANKGFTRVENIDHWDTGAAAGRSIGDPGIGAGFLAELYFGVNFGFVWFPGWLADNSLTNRIQIGGDAGGAPGVAPFVRFLAGDETVVEYNPTGNAALTIGMAGATPALAQIASISPAFPGIAAPVPSLTALGIYPQNLYATGNVGKYQAIAGQFVVSADGSEGLSRYTDVYGLNFLAGVGTVDVMRSVQSCHVEPYSAAGGTGDTRDANGFVMRFAWGASYPPECGYGTYLNRVLGGCRSFGAHVADPTYYIAHPLAAAFGVQVETFDLHTQGSQWPFFYSDVPTCVERDPVSGGNDEYSGIAGEHGMAEAGTANTLTDTDRAWTVNQWVGYNVTITAGAGVGQTRGITANTATRLTVAPNWGVNPDATSIYEINLNTATTLADPRQVARWAVNEHRGRIVSISGSTQAASPAVGQKRRIVSNTTTVLTVSPAWTNTPDGRCMYHIEDYVAAPRWGVDGFGFEKRRGQWGFVCPGYSGTSWAYVGLMYLASLVGTNAKLADTTGLSFIQSTAGPLNQQAYACTRQGAGAGDVYRPDWGSVCWGKFRLIQTTSERLFAGFTSLNPVGTVAGNPTLQSDAPNGQYAGVQYSTSRGDTTFKFVVGGGLNQTIVDSYVAIDTNVHYYYVGMNKDDSEIIVAIYDANHVLQGATVFTVADYLPTSTVQMWWTCGIQALVAAARFICQYEHESGNRI